MGSKRLQERLEAEIQELESKVQWKHQPSKEPAELDAANQSAQGYQTGEEKIDSAATESQSDDHQSEKNFDATISPEQNDDTQEEPTTQKRISWKTRFTNLKKYHDAEIYKLRQLSGQLFDKIKELETQNDVLAEKLQEYTKESRKSIKDLATQEEIDRIGEEELQMFDRLTQQKIEAETKSLKEQLKRAKEAERAARQKQAQEVKQQAFSIFLDKLGQVVPDYEVLDKHPDFPAWLQQHDPVSGFRRMDLFKQAEASGDVGRVAGFFQEFKKELQSAQQTLDNKVTPVGNSVTQPTTQNHRGKAQPELIPMKEYLKFMDDSTRGRYKGRESLERELTLKFEKAISEGRLI